MIDAEGNQTMPANPAVSRRKLVAWLGATPAAVALFAGIRAGSAAKQSGKKRTKDEKSKGKGKGKGKTGNQGKHKKQDASGSAADVVQIAKKNKGAKYVWGGESPRGFDCSGFTWYCFEQATGMDIGRTEDEQWKRGNSVGKDELKPGDLVFFKNTFEKGLSHVGISLGGAKFIHAENEDTGVVISTHDSGYYDDHWAGARRLV